MMRQDLLKRAVITTFGCALLMVAVGCNSASSSSSVAQPTTTPTDAMDDNTTTEHRYENLQMGMGIVVSSEADGLTDNPSTSTSGKLSHTAVSVLLDDDVICGSTLDVHESNLSVQDGGLGLPVDMQSKREKGDTYGMRAFSDIGKEWYEQADAFCYYIQGMTCEEVMNIPVDEYGAPTETDLAAGCTISIQEFQQAVEKACNNSKKVTDMEIEDYTNHKNNMGGDGLLGDLVDGTEDVLEGVEDGVNDIVNGADDMMNNADGTNRTGSANY